jgi:hypothetical protein
MSHAGERRPTDTMPPAPARRGAGLARLQPRSRAGALAMAVGAGALGALAWALLKGILEFPGVLAVAVVAGWGIGALLWQGRVRPLVAALIAAAAWGLGLVLTWLVSMAILPGSSRTFLERLAATPFLEWQAPQFGGIEMVGLLLYVVAALYGARPRSR